jgi:hypothetical protein
VNDSDDMRTIEDRVQTDGTVETPDPDAEAAAAAAAAQERLASVVDHIRRESRAARITSPVVFATEPFSLTEEQLAEVWTAIAGDTAYADIVRTADERSGEEFLHSTTYLTVPYALLLLRSQANDPAYLIAETVRDYSKTYPRPTSVEFFELEPFNLKLEEVFAHLTIMGSLEEYADVKQLTVSNGMVYLYSDRYLAQPQAQSIAQWDEVDSHLNSNQ